MTRAELELAFRQQQAENAVLHAEIAQVCQRALPTATLAPVPHNLLVHLMQDQFTAVILADADGRVSWANNGFIALCGFRLSEVVGRKAELLLLRAHLTNESTLAYIEEGLRTKTGFQYEVRNPRKAGEWIRVKVLPVHNLNHEVVQLVVLVEDITEWKNTQLALAENEIRFKALAENVPGVLYEWRKNRDGSVQFLYVSPKLHELFGISVEDIVRMPDFVHPDDLTKFQESIAVAIQNQAPWAYDVRLVVAGQPLRWMRGNSIVTCVDELGVVYSGILLDITPLKLAEAALRERNLRWHLAVEGFGDGIWEMNLRTRHISFSADYKAMLGYADAEFLNEYDTWLAHVHPEDREEALRTVATHLRGDSPMAKLEYRLRCKNGSYKWVMNRALVTERDAAGQPLVLTGVHTDTSELKLAKLALEATARRLSTVIANFQEGLVLEDENRHIVLTNDAFCRLLGMPVTPEQLIGKAGDWLVESSKRYIKKPHQYLARIAALLYRRKPVSGDIILLRDGRILQRDFTPIYDQSGYIGQLWKYADATARIKAEEELKRREEKYRGIIENMSLGLVEADLDDHLIYANQSFCDMTGFCNEELRGSPLSPILLSGQDLELVESKLESRQKGIADSYEISVTTKTGGTKWLLVSGAPLYGSNHQPIGSIGIYLDVTPQKELEEGLREAKALAEINTHVKQDFLANMSHEIRTPMNAILGMSQLLAKTPLDGTQTSYLHAITASAENLLVIINDILDLSKIEAGRMAIEQIGFSPSQVYTQVEKTLLYKAEEKGLGFEIQVAPDVPAVLLGDPYRLTQVLLNLVGNSVKFTEKGHVSVACTVVGRPTTGEVLVEFQVQDTGIGIDPDYLARVFDDFSQEDSSVTRRFGGTGLGLGISKKLVELLGGTLDIESQKDHGTTSRFTLRLSVGTIQDVPQKYGVDITALQHALRGKRILLVEDNLFNRMLASIFLANAELDVTEAENGLVAVAVARAQSFDLILMDVQMPVMNGYEATAILRADLGLDVPIIALTANAILGERAKCLAAGMNDYLTKPFQEDALIKMVYDWVIGDLGQCNEPPEA